MQQLVDQSIFEKVSNIRGRLISTHFNQLYYDLESPQKALEDLADTVQLDQILNKTFHTFYILTEEQLEYLAKQNGASEDSDAIQNLRSADTEFFYIDKKGYTHPVDFTLAMSVFGMVDYYLGLQAQQSAKQSHYSKRNSSSDYKEHVFTANRYPGDNKTQAPKQSAVNTQKNVPQTRPVRHFWKRAKLLLSDFLSK